MARIPIFASVSAVSCFFLPKGTVGRIFDLRKNRENGTAKMGTLSHVSPILVPFPSHFPPIVRNHIPPQPSTTHIPCALRATFLSSRLPLLTAAVPQVGNMTLIPMGMETAPYQIWEGSPCQFRGVAAPNPEHHPDSAAPRQGFTLGTWAPEPNPALPDHRRGDAVVAAAHASTVVEVAGADADRATGKATPWREAGSPLPVSRQASAPDMRGRKVRPLFGRLVPCLQLLGIVFASLLTVVSYLPFIEAFLFSVKANPGSLVSAALGLEVIAPERICGAESSGALVTTPNATRPCVFPFTFPASHPGNADRWGRNRGSIREFTQCSAVACGGDPAGGRPVYRCCATAAVWAEDAWAECLSCPNTASPTEEANLKYLGFVVLLELTLGAFIVFPILFTVILMVLRPCLLIGLRGTRTFPVSSFAYFRRWMLDLLMDEVSSLAPCASPSLPQSTPQMGWSPPPPPPPHFWCREIGGGPCMARLTGTKGGGRADPDRPANVR